jgi:hypothetical protein
MAENPSSEPVRITGEERKHPALRKLARALIALARLHPLPPSSTSAALVEPAKTEVEHD